MPSHLPFSGQFSTSFPCIYLSRCPGRVHQKAFRVAFFPLQDQARPLKRAALVRAQTYCACHPKRFSMNYYPIFILITVILVGVAGCTQPGAPPPAKTENQTVQGTPGGNETVTASPAPQETMDRALVPMVPVKDSRLRIAFYLPEDWSVSTRQVPKPEGSEGLAYRTDLLDNNRFYIVTYTVSRNEDQAYRNEIRRTWIPTPTESTVVIHGITYDRFESSLAGTTNVSYVVRKGSANELGYASVLFFTTKGSRPDEMSEFMRVISSFRYFTGSEAATIPGTEIE
jgi:hypothetical protein